MDLPQQLSPTKIQFTFQAFATRSATQNWQELLSLLYYRLLNIINQFPIPFRFTPLIMLYSLAHQRCLINFPNFFIYLYSSYYHFTNSNNYYYHPNFHTFVLYSNSSHLYYSYYCNFYYYNYCNPRTLYTNFYQYYSNFNPMSVLIPFTAIFCKLHNLDVKCSLSLYF